MKSDNWLIRIRKILTPFLIYLLVAVAVEFAASFVVSFTVIFRNGTSIANDMAKYQKLCTEMLNRHALEMTLAVQVVCALIFAAMFRKDSKKFVPVKVKMNPFSYIAALALGAGAALFLNGVMMLSGLYSLLEETYADSADVLYNTSKIWLTVLTAGIMAPVMEELLFRGIIYKRMRTYCIFSLAALVSSIIFGIYHENMLQFIYATCLGLVIAFAFERFRSLSGAILVHMGANFLSIVLSLNATLSNMVFASVKRLTFATFVALFVVFACIMILNNLSKSAQVIMPEADEKEVNVNG